MTTAKKKPENPTVIKKYANRRLYDTGRSSYVTLDDLCVMVKEGHEFVVYDAKTGEDLTRSVLTQIIVEQESRGQNLLPIPFLRQLIGFYGDSLEGIIPNYLEQSIEAFSKNQEQFRQQMGKSFEGMGLFNPVTALEEMNRKNMEMFESAMRAWSPFGGQAKPGAAQTGSSATGSAASKEERIHELEKHIAMMEKELERLSRR